MAFHLGGNQLPWSTNLWILLVSLVGAAVAALIAALAPYVWASRRPKSFPPGPKPLPIIGNLNLIPPSKAFTLFHEWTKQYGPIIGLKFGPANVVVLNHWKDVQELLEKRGDIYSSRPANYIANELICKNETHILFAPYGDGWKALRRAAQGLFTPASLASVLPIQEAEATQTLYDILREPARYYEHIQRYTTAVILASVFGQRGEDFNSPNVQALYDVQNRFTALLEPGAAPPVDGITFLQHIPESLAPWKRRAKEIRRDQRALYFRLLNGTKERMGAGVRTGCFMEKLLDDQVKNRLDEEHTTYLGGILMEAGSDTTSSTLLSFLLALLENPVALRRAQEDVDRVCGVERSPNMSDLDDLPYIEACMHEILRWRPVAAGGIPHMLTQTDTYKGYIFPAGTIFFANTWAIHHDENEYDEPASFNPDRWLGGNKFGTKENISVLAPSEEKQQQQQQQRKTSYGWGAGRRICSGQKMAEASLKINIAKMVWAFDFAVEDEGAGADTRGGRRPDVSVETGYQDGFLVCPKKFPVRIMPRSEKHEAVVKREFEGFKKFYDSLAS